MAMANIAYIRVSSEDQSEARQIETMKQYNIDRYFTEKKSGKNTDRPQLQEMLRYIREGDVVYIADFSRLARSTLDLLTLVNDFKDRNITLVSIKECVDTSTATGRLMLQMIGAINEFERANLLERQAEGIALAKKRGVYKGRKKITLKDVPDFPKLYDKWNEHSISKSAIAKELRISRPTVDRLIAEYRDKYKKPTE